MMIHKVSQLKSWAWVVSFCLFGLSPLAMAAMQEAGQVLMTAGATSAKGADGQIRALARRAPIFVGDTVTTGSESQLQIRMKDGAMIALGASAEFGVKAYSYKQAGDAKDGAVLSLVKGGLRTISGKIEKSTYSLQTPVATLGIRGTVFDVYVKADGTTIVILWDGSVIVTDAKGNTQILKIPGLATIIEKNGAPSEPGKPPQDILDYLRGILPFIPDHVKWPEGGDDPTIFEIIDILNDQPPTVNGDGEPDTGPRPESPPQPPQPTQPPTGCGRNCQ